MKHFEVALPEGELKKISSLGLAHVGDAVFELMVRTRLAAEGRVTARGLHRATVSFVSARAQAALSEKLLPSLSEEETEVYKRGRNAHVHAVPKGASAGEYHAATGFEALFGYLYLSGRRDRLDEIFEACWEAAEHGA